MRHLIIALLTVGKSVDGSSLRQFKEAKRRDDRWLRVTIQHLLVIVSARLLPSAQLLVVALHEIAELRRHGITIHGCQILSGTFFREFFRDSIT